MASPEGGAYIVRRTRGDAVSPSNQRLLARPAVASEEPR